MAPEVDDLAQQVRPFGPHGLGDRGEPRDATRVVPVDTLTAPQRTFVDAEGFENDQPSPAFCAGPVIFDVPIGG